VKVKSRVNSGNACYHSIQNLLSSRLLSKNLKIKKQDGCETWSLTLKEEHRLMVFEDRALREYLDPRGSKWREAGEDCIMRSFIHSTLHKILLG